MHKLAEISINNTLIIMIFTATKVELRVEENYDNKQPEI